MTDQQPDPQYPPPPATPNPPEPSAHPTHIAPEDIEKNKIWAIISYLGIIGIIIAFVSDGKNSPYVKFHLNQSVCLLIAALIGSAITMIPIIGWLLAPIVGLVVLVFVIMGIINAAQGQVKRLPLIGDFDLIK